MRTREFAIMLWGIAGAGLTVWLAITHLSNLWVVLLAWPGYIAGQIGGALLLALKDWVSGEPHEAGPASEHEAE